MKNSVLILFFLIIPFLVFGQDGERIISRLQEKFESIKNLSADFLQLNELPDLKKPLTYKGKFLFEKADKYRIEMKNSEIITDGKTIWNYNKKKKKVVIDNAENNQEIYSIKKIVYDFPAQSTISYIGKELVNGDSCFAVRLNPKGKDKTFDSVKLWIDEKDLIKKFEIQNPDNTIIKFELSAIRINQNIPDDKFVFNPPQGTEIIDLR
jgi:chaperone LolA